MSDSMTPVEGKADLATDYDDGFLCEVAQLLFSVKMDWEQSGAWTEWDQSVLDRFAKFRAARCNPEK